VFFDEKGNPILDNSVGSRRRRITKMWYNDKWLSRLMAAEQLLTGFPPAGEDGLVLQAGLVSVASPRGLNEAILDPSDEKVESSEEADHGELILDEHEEGDADE
jgi:hypothetical protein